MKEILKIRLEKLGNKHLYYEVLEQDYDHFKRGDFNELNGRIKSSYSPEILKDDVYLRGIESDEDHDGYAYKFDTTQKRNDSYDNIVQVFKYYSETLQDNTEWEKDLNKQIEYLHKFNRDEIDLKKSFFNTGYIRFNITLVGKKYIHLDTTYLNPDLHNTIWLVASDKHIPVCLELGENILLVGKIDRFNILNQFINQLEKNIIKLHNEQTFIDKGDNFKHEGNIITLYS
jgi:hypothetical protein